MKITKFKTSEGEFIGLIGLPGGIIDIFKDKDNGNTYAYFIDHKTVIEDLPDYDKIIGFFKSLDGSQVWNKLGSFDVSTGAFLLNTNPFILK